MRLYLLTNDEHSRLINLLSESPSDGYIDIVQKAGFTLDSVVKFCRY